MRLLSNVTTNFINYINEENHDDDDDDNNNNNLITPNHDILSCSRHYTLISIFPDAPRADIGSNLVQRPQPETIPNNNFHIINRSRRLSWKTTINSAGIIPY